MRDFYSGEKMPTLLFTCGYCKRPTADAPTRWSTRRTEEDVAFGTKPIEIVAQCSVCGRFSVLRYADWTGGGGEHRWLDALEQDEREILTDLPDEQHPPLYRRAPIGTHDPDLWSAWYEAERVNAIQNAPTATGMAYRRVVEIAVKQLDPEPEKQQMLGRRIERLQKAGVLSDDLADLLEAAKAFGNEAAHSDSLSADDAAIARDLCEALLRQCFTVPHLLEAARERMAARDEAKRKKAARRQARSQSATKPAGNADDAKPDSDTPAP